MLNAAAYLYEITSDIVAMVTVFSATAGGGIECTKGERCVSGSHVLQKLLQTFVQLKQKFPKSE